MVDSSITNSLNYNASNMDYSGLYNNYSNTSNNMTGIIGGIANLAGSAINAYSQYKMNQQNIQAQKDMQSSQNAWNEQMWNKNNEYNTPTAQKERLEEAGLNPAFYMGNNVNNTTQGSANSQTVNTPNLKAPEIDPRALADGFTQFAQLAMQKKLNDSQVTKNEADAKAALADAGLKDSQSDESKARTVQIKNTTMTPEQFAESTNLSIETQKKTNDKLQADTDQLKVLKDYTEQQKMSQENFNKTFDKRFEMEMKQAASQIGLNGAMSKAQLSQAEQVMKYTAEYLTRGSVTSGRDEQGNYVEIKELTMFDLISRMQEIAAEKGLKEVEYFDANQWAQIVETYTRSFSNVANGVEDFAKAYADIKSGGKADYVTNTTSKSHNNVNDK